MEPDKSTDNFEFADEFYEAYANSIIYESSSWDLKLVFGQLDQSEGTVKVVQHSAITLPWTQAKLMLYWLRGQIEIHELLNGKIHIPPPVIPPPPPPLTEEIKKSDQNAEVVYSIFNRLRDEFLANLNK
ncbi:MAG TPA: DUF3467 domain-containing protein [Pyrinomonadaceae bacterium]